MERKLTAILCADLHGYSRLMGDDEEATFRALSSHRKIIDALIEQHRGRFVNSAGDSVLAEFASVVNAVECGVEIQRTLNAENQGIPPARRLQFRIGVNLGDVIVDGEQIYGDGVNVAARLESLAEPGGICISGKVHDEIGHKLPLSYQDLGEQSVKNIADPIRVFRVLSEAGGWTAGTSKPQARARKYMRSGVFSIAGLAVIAATVVVVQHLSLRPPTPSASVPPVQSPALPLPDKPSIAVLPFVNMSRDRDQEYFSDGITDDLITSLSRLPDLFVIARTSTFTYKSKAAKVQEISRELGVRYVLEGSVRKAGGIVRITAQLVDATTGDHLWAAHYDRPLRDIFSLQDDIVRKIATTLKLRLSVEEWQEVVGQHTDNLEAYDYYLRGVQYSMSLSQEGLAKGTSLFEMAIKLDRTYADAYAFLGGNYLVAYILQFSGPNALDRAIQLEQQAVSLDDANADAHGLLGRAYLYKAEYDKAIAECERAIDLKPNLAIGNYFMASVLNRSGKPAEAIDYVNRAERLDPSDRALYESERAIADILMGRYEDGIRAFKAHLAAYPNNFFGHFWQAVAYIELNRETEARAEAAEVLRFNPHFSLEAEKRIVPLRPQTLADRVWADARKAGLK